MKNPKPASSAEANLSTWRGAVVTEHHGEMRTVHLAAHVFVTPAWICWIETTYTDPLGQIRPSFHLRDGGPNWAGGGFKTSTAADRREIAVVPFDPELHHAIGEGFRSFSDWLAYEGSTWEEERARMSDRVSRAIDRVKSRHPYAIECWDAFWGEPTTEPAASDRSINFADLDDEISALVHELDAVLLPLAGQVKALAVGIRCRDLMDEMLSSTYSEKDLVAAPWLEAQIRILIIAVTAAGRLLDEGCYDDARAVARGARRVMQLTKGHLRAVKAKRVADGRRGGAARRAVGDLTRSRIERAAQALMSVMGRSEAAEKIALEIGKDAETVRKKLTEIFPGDRWPGKSRRNGRKRVG